MRISLSLCLSVAFLIEQTTAFTSPPSLTRPIAHQISSSTVVFSAPTKQEKSVEKESFSPIDEIASPTDISTSGDSSATANLPTWFAPAAWRGVVIVLCALWASNFAVAKLVMAEPGVDSSLYALARFSVAALALAPSAIGIAKRSGIDMETIKTSAQCGSWVAFGYLGQTLGLLSTTASKSCVICSMHCVFVAIIAEFMRVSRSVVGTKFDTSRLFPALLAVIGVAVVELQGSAGPPTIGDALSFAQPIGFGMGYLQLEELMSKRPDMALPVSAIKLMVVALASFGLFELAPLVQGAADSLFTMPDFTPIISSPIALGGILYTGLVTTALALWVESIAFREVPATDASIILTTEPLFAAALGAYTLGETFGTSDYAGAALIIGACALASTMESPGDEMCDPEKDENCVPPRKWDWPFWTQ